MKKEGQMTDTTEFDFDAMIARNSEKPKEVPEPESMLFYGQAGSGKTHLSGTILDAPGFKRGLILDTEGSTTVIDNPNFDIVRVDKYSAKLADGSVHPHSKFMMLNKILFGDSTGATIQEGGLFHPDTKTSYDVVIIDTFDVAQEWAVDFFSDEEAGAVMGANGAVDGFKTWASVSNWSMDIAREMKSMKPLGIMVAHDREEKSNAGTITKRLELSGSSKNKLPGTTDLVVYLERKNTSEGPKTTAYFATEDNKVTKSRYEKLGVPAVVEEFTLPWFYKTTRDARKKMKNAG